VRRGDLVKMEGPYYDNVDMWGIGVVVRLEKSPYKPQQVVAVVYWSEQAALSWDEDFQLEVIGEAR